MTVNAVSRCVLVPKNVDGKLYGTANLGACRVDVVGGGGAGLSYGAGANAQAWSGKTVYTDEDFGSDIPASPASANSAGFRGFQGFSGTFTNVTYPMVETPFGTKRVLRVTFPGQTETITALGGATTAWAFKGTEYSNASARITGTWSGTLVFEKSTDGGSSWSSMNVTRVSDSATVSSTTANGTFLANTGSSVEHFRVRASAWTSGTATVSVGMQGGQAPARMTAGTFNASQGKIYTRVVCRVSVDFDNNGNVGTKFFFFRQADGDNHYVAGVSSGNVLAPSIALQPARTSVATASVTGALDEWHDLEFYAIANTSGSANGVMKTFLNGVEAASRSDFITFDTGDTPAFYEFFFDPTYGGGLNPPPANIYLDIAYWYRESAA